MTANLSQDIVFLRGRRINLRPVLREDVPTLLRWINDPDVRQFLTAYLPMTEVDEERWVESLSSKKPHDLTFAIVTKKGKLIGTMGIHGISWKDGTGTTGALIGEKRYWGKGYGTEAKMLLLDYAFNTLNLRKICSLVLTFNGRSQAYLTKCGYVQEGRRRRQHYHEGRYWDCILMAVFKRNWLPLWRKYRERYFA